MDKLARTWMDAELSVLHVYELVIIWLLTDGTVPHLIVGTLIFINMVYALRRAAWVGKHDRDYLKLKEGE